MVLEKTSRLVRVTPDAATLSLIIPADLVKDSRFPFAKNGDNVTVKIDGENKRLLIEELKNE